LGPDNQFSINIDIYNQLEHEWLQEKNKDDFKVVSAVAHIYNHDILVKEIDILGENEEHFLHPYSENIYLHEFVELEEEFE
ncbi:hypothetical protein, partial [Pseudomonas sp. 2995-1]|uniref:hypothetical protein n=1 Tax=Pseudomonas sp. 2995-1 TaxID=1712679 RepID=UPI000C67197C